MSVEASIREKARELGFDGCHFTSAAPPESRERLDDWLQAEYHGEMAWMARRVERRHDLQKVLPGAQSVIVLTLNYFPEGAKSDESAESMSSSASDRPRGVVARYARYRDYHKMVGKRLKALAEWLPSLSGVDVRSLPYVDTGPILERDLAERAGAGFIGKHTNLISRQLGNWLFLGEIVTTLELEPDLPERNRCGTCRKCIDACPTEAIRAPFQLDARRCISYLTIELRGSIPEALRPAIGNRIFGCDDCLAVCPWNRFAQAGNMMRDYRRYDLDQPDLLELLELDEEGFYRRFAGTPIVRTKRRGLLRNVCVALGNVGDQSALPHLERATQDPEPLVVEHAEWAIKRIRERYEPLLTGM